jgi:hypothetical protein
MRAYEHTPPSQPLWDECRSLEPLSKLCIRPGALSGRCKARVPPHRHSLPLPAPVARGGAPECAARQGVPGGGVVAVKKASGARTNGHARSNALSGSFARPPTVGCHSFWPQAPRERLWVERPGISVQGPGISVQGPGISVQGPGISVQGPGISVQGPGISVQGSRIVFTALESKQDRELGEREENSLETILGCSVGNYSAVSISGSNGINTQW